MKARFLDHLEPRLLLAAFTSDDFHSPTLNSSLWTFVDPAGGASVSMTGTNAVIALPAGGNRDAWNPNQSARLMQPANNEDFELEVKFESKPTGAYTEEGLIIEQSAGNYLRFDFYSDGASLRAFAASFSNGSPAPRSNKSITPPTGSVLYMRVGRVGNNWTQSYSYDGTNWTTAATFSHTLAVSKVGVFAGSDGGGAPAFAASVDYFFNSAAPIVPEDGGVNPGPTAPPPVISNVQTSLETNQVQVSWTTDEPTTGLVQYGLTDAYGSSVNDPTLSTNHTVTLSLASFTTYHFRIRATKTNSATALTPDDLLRSGGPVQAAPVIDIWYGDNQAFGQIGHPQRWVNILGRASDPDDVAAMNYRLNGGSAITLWTGSNNTRLPSEGDFNIELPVTALNNGANTLVISATDVNNNTSTRTVNFTYTNANVWPSTYTANWSGASNPNQIAQVVDGLWQVDGDGVRTVDMGYDRLIAIGDITWQDYEVTVPVTVHNTNPNGFYAPPGFGMIFRWSGHYGDEFEPSPNTQWWPIGAIGWHNDRLRIYGNNISFIAAETQASSIALEQRYFMKMRVETVPGQRSEYSLKMWQDGQPEPAAWTIDGEGVAGELTNGSMLLVAHYTDLTYGPVTITPLGDTAPIISGVNPTPASNSIQVNWNTNEPTTGVVRYGLTTSYELGTTAATARGTSHSRTLPALQPGQTYHFQVVATDDTNHITSSGDFQATTTVPDTTGPNVQNVTSNPGTNSIVVNWTTNEPATAIVKYGLTTSYELGTVSQSVLGTSHSVTLNGLQIGQTYHFQIVASDALGNPTTTGDFQATTRTGAFQSDDFSSGTLNTSLWQFVNPRNDSSSASVNGTNLLLSVAAGADHDAWTTNNAVRVMQTATNEDFELEVKFESKPSARFTEQGLLVEASTGNYLRFDFYSDGSTLRVFAASILGGGASIRHNASITIPSQPVLYMRVTRVGNQWTQKYSYNGTTWQNAGSFSATLAVTKVGVFAGNDSPSPAFVASVDYFFNTASPIVPEDNTPPVVRTTIPVNNPNLFFSPDNWVANGSTYKQAVNTGAYFKTKFTGTSANLVVDTSMLTTPAADFPTIRYRVDGGAWLRQQLNAGETSLVLASALAAGTHDLEVWFVATQDGGTRWTNPSNVLRITGLSLDDQATVAAPTLRPNRALVFGDSITEGRYVLGAGGTAASDASQTWDVNLGVASRLNAEMGIIGWNAQGWFRPGNGGVPRFHEPGVTANQSWRYLYNGQLRDFSDAPDYVLINLGTNDAINGVSDASVQAAVTDFLIQLRSILPTTPIYLIVPFGGYDRSPITAGYNAYRAGAPGDTNAKLIDIGTNGTAQVTAPGNMTDSLHPNVNGHAVAADLAWVAMNPTPDTTDPIVGNVATQRASNQITITWTTDEATTGIVRYGVTTSYSLGTTAPTTRGTSHSVTLTGLQPGQTYHFQIVATDDSGNDTTTGDYQAATTTGAFQSDDFSSGPLNTSLWAFVNPRNDSSSATVSSNRLNLSVAGGAEHDAWTTNNSVRVMQAAANEDFEMEVKFESKPSARFTEQGLLVEASPGNYLRFDFYSDGSTLRVFAASIASGGAAVRANAVITIPSQPLLYMRVTRLGNQWTQKYSYDGTTWQTAASFSATLAVTKVGVFAGNDSPAPAFTAIVDYFFNTALPIQPEHGPAALTAPASKSTATSSSTKKTTKDSYSELEKLLSTSGK